MGQQFVEPDDGMRSDSRQHILEPGERIHLHQFTGGNEAA